MKIRSPRNFTPNHFHCLIKAKTAASPRFFSNSCGRHSCVSSSFHLMQPTTLTNRSNDLLYATLATHLNAQSNRDGYRFQAVHTVV